MQDCPVCGWKYNKYNISIETGEFCPQCGWHLFPAPHNMRAVSGELQTVKWARKTWDRLSQLQKECSLLQERNHSLLKQYLAKIEDIQANTQNLPEMLSILRQINEKSQEKDSFGNQTQTTRPGDYEEDKQVSNYEIDDPEITSLVENYNNHAEFTDKIDVSETEESKSHRWSGGKDPAIFELNSRGRGDYWIIANQYLVPKLKHKINQHSYKTISVLFDFRNYDDNEHVSLDDMMLVKPAKVIPIPNQEKWQLQDTGILEFKTQI
ncbi:hypothetical protein [Cylindrospermopsis raciborskii]|jgi:hypothetical protein|uniref:hypothetical protein n=1 Tax=Cylindrospermopsis raciborskii TaxID=77022 RepID=UPI000B6082D4|nr:hypothetical protein [Cylindrospermopsis raciborskii]UJL35049.1 hypothetical protein C6N34_007815 [Cylindrospermopsis raciborskii Cr2010]UJS04590.1 hypothetical protein L3I90_16245 [Cylindrospermopsis raciborskii KLL07]BAZ91176.1 hypothetical protein NIES932_26830 [Raphidiopsis curvata NIES-932]